MAQPDQITRDIARKCADDVSAAMKRNMALADTPEAKLSVSLSAASTALGGASGTYLGLLDARDQPPVHHLAAADGIWHTLRPMVLKAMADIHAMKGIEEPEWFPSSNPFAPVDILPCDRDALYGGLISAGHPAHYARHMASDMPNDDGSLQMLARHRLAHVPPAHDPSLVDAALIFINDVQNILLSQDSNLAIFPLDSLERLMALMWPSFGTSPATEWDHRYRPLAHGEIIDATDECRRDDGTWVTGICVGQPAPDPAYTSHRVYRRLIADGGAA